MYFQKKSSHLFSGTRSLENQIDEFLDKVSEAGMVFDRAMRVYLKQGSNEEFNTFLSQAASMERRGDDLRRAVEAELYVRTLIPDLRADVLALLEGIDHLINVYEGDLFRISIQSPEIPEEFHAGFLDLVETVVICVDSVVLAARAFFRDIDAVRDHCSKTIFLETEADKIGTKLQRAIFASELPLERKMHLRYFVERIDELANSAEDVADDLQIYTIKRRI
jgi:predicted phosphate transport protein (TIGR00153 family)